MAQSNPIFALIWLVLLIFLAWPVAFAMSGCWIILQVKYRYYYPCHMSDVWLLVL